MKTPVDGPRLTDFSAFLLLTTDLGRRTVKMVQATVFVFNFVIESGPPQPIGCHRYCDASTP